MNGLARALKQGTRALDKAATARFAHAFAEENAPVSPWLLGGALAAGFAAYVYTSKKQITHDRNPLQAEFYKSCHIPPNLEAVDARGRDINVAASLYGKHALLEFGTLHSSETTAQYSKVCRAAELATQRLGKLVVPVFYSIDEDRDKPADLYRLASISTGAGTAMVIAGSHDGMLAAAERFLRCEQSKELKAAKDQEKYKKGIDRDIRQGYATDHVFGVDSEGKFVAVMPQGAGIQDLTDKLVQSIEAGAVGKKQAKEA